MRTFALLNNGKPHDFRENVLKWLTGGGDVVVFSTPELFEQTLKDFPDVKHVGIPEEISKSESSQRNFIIRHFKKEQTCGFLHVLSRTTKILKDPATFIDSVERMMKALGNKTWFSCTSDMVNYVYGRFYPRFDIQVDDQQVKNSPFKNVMLCSNANTEWTIFDMEGLTDEESMLDEAFTIPMYYIIEFLARRRNNKKPGEFYYMNLYPTINEEIGVFKHENEPEDKKSDAIQTMKSEGAVFQSKGINHTADGDVVRATEDLRNLLLRL